MHSLDSMRIHIAGLLLALTSASAAWGAPPSGRTPIQERGHALFMQYCATCHGPSGRGDGSIAQALRTPPSDLTKIAERRDGRFPVADIMTFIDGRKAVVAHGEREMPVWGERFAEAAVGSTKDKDVTVNSKLRALIEYLQSIQVAPAAAPAP